jgi:transcriptional regulator with XRE-family HTH domain
MLTFPRAAVDEIEIRARIYAAEQSPGLVGSILGRYRMQAGLSLDQLAARLGLTLAALAGLAHETRPRVVGIDGTIRLEHGIAELAVHYRADADQLVEAFNLKGHGPYLRPLA